MALNPFINHRLRLVLLTALALIPPLIFILIHAHFDRLNAVEEIKSELKRLNHAAADGAALMIRSSRMDSSTLKSMSRRFLLPVDADVIVLSRNGEILSRYPVVDGKGTALTLENEFVTATRIGEGSFEASGPDGLSRIYVLDTVPGTTNAVCLGIGYPSSLPDAKARKTLVHNLIILGLVALFAMMAAWFGGYYVFVRHLKSLVLAARRLEAGDLKARAGVPDAPGELGELSKAFDDMANSLEQNEIRRKQAEQGMQVHMHLLQTVIDAIPNPVYYKNTAGIFQGCNKAFEAFMGESKDRMIGKTIFDLVSREAADRIQLMDAALWRQPGMQTYESAARHANGTWHQIIYCKATYNNLENELDGMVGVMVDITDHKRTEDALAWEAQVNSTVADISRNLIDGLPLNQIAEQIFEQAVQLTGSNQGYVAYITPDSGQLCVAAQTDHAHETFLLSDRNLSIHKVPGPCGWVLRHKEPVLSNDIINDCIRDEIDPAALSIKRFIAVPALIGDTLAGQIVMGEAERDFNDKDLLLLERLASLFAMAVQRHWADETLRKEMDFSSTILDTASVLVVVLDRMGRILRFNRACEEVTGYVQSRIKNSFVTDTLVLADEVESFRKVMKQLLGGQYPIQHECHWRTQSGDKRLISWSSTLVLDSKGAVDFIVCTGTDITHRKEVEAMRIKDSAIACSINAIAIAGLTGNLIYVNRSFLKMWGFEKDSDVLGKPWLDFAVDSAVQNPVISALQDKGAWTGELIMRRSDGSQFTVEAVASLVTNANEEPICMVGSFMDITKRKWIEGALRESEAKYRVLSESAPDAIFMTTPDLRLVYANPAAATIFQKSQPELVGKSLQSLFRDDAVAIHRAMMVQVFQSGEPLSYDEKLDLPDQEVWLHVSLSPIMGGDNQVSYTLAIARDITYRKQTEEALARQARELENRSADLTRSNAELERFAYVASHDLQEPLRMVSSYVQLLDRRYREKLDSNATEYINFAVEGAKRMQQLINDLLAYSRVGSRSKPFKMVNLERVLENSLSNLKIAIEESHAEITHDALPTVLADDMQMVQLFQNLLGNAVKFRGQEPPRIHIHVLHKDHGWSLSFKDNGIGIAPQYYERIFLIFQRLHGREEYPGTGIGLAVCKKIVERHNGTIWVESEVGKGATFHFTLPGGAQPANIT